MEYCPKCGGTVLPEHRFCPTCAEALSHVPRASDPFLSQVVGGSYLVRELIGEGGMGRVYKAEQVALGKSVAIKVIHGHLVGDESAIARFYTEANRVTNRAVLIPILNETFGARPAGEWLAQLEEHGVPAGRIKTVPEVCESPHLKERGMVVSLPHPKAGSVTVMGVPIRLGETPGAALLPPPLLGEHTDEILTRLLRLPKSKVDKLRAAGVV